MTPLPACPANGLDRLIRKSTLCLGTIVLLGLSPGGRAEERSNCAHVALAAMLAPQGAIELVDMPAAFTPGQIGKARVKVSNTGLEAATGYSQAREVWIDFRLIDATGREFYRLGAIKDGRTEPGTRVLPKRQVVEEFSFAIPGNAVGPITVRADLNYWPFPQKLADVILGPNKLRVDITRIASAASQVPLSRVRPNAVEQMERLLLLLAVGHAR